MHGSPYYRTNLGDWNKSGNATRSSDWMPGHFRAFYEATKDDFWLNAADTVYNLLAQCSDPTTGLIPDFAKGAPAKPDASGGGTGEENADKYSYNACRDPWRLALAYAHHGDAKAKEQIDKISKWLRGATNSLPANIKAGYYLDGKALANWEEIIFTASFASGMIANSENQYFLNSTYNTIRTVKNGNNEYSTALQLLNVLLISGNWWAPYSSGSTPIVFENHKEIKTTGITVSKSGINFNVPGEKTVQVKISDIKGRLLLSRNVTLNLGVASLDFPSSITRNQTLVLNVKGKNGLNVSQKILPQ